MRAIFITAAGFITACVLTLLPTTSFAAAADTTTGGAVVEASSAQTLRFWGYWQQDGSRWTFATTGPAQAKPEDGGVEGWRFAVSKGEEGTPPRAKPDFERICQGERPRDGRKRVAVVIDYGEAADAPEGQNPPEPKTGCAVVPTAATGADALAAVTKPRNDSKGLVCAIDAFPAGACGGQEAAAPAPGQSANPAAPSDAADPAAATGNTGLIGGLVVVLIVAAVGVFFVIRRRRAAGPPAR